MKKKPVESTQDIARALFEVRANLAATRAALDDDCIVVHPILGTEISGTRYWRDGLLVSKRRARRFIQDAYLCATRLLRLTESCRRAELTALAMQLMETIHAVLFRLCKDDVASDDDRIAARRAVERPWQLSEIAICYFISTEPACAPKLKD
jgi:hypothetical protein